MLIEMMRDMQTYDVAKSHQCSVCWLAILPFDPQYLVYQPKNLLAQCGIEAFFQ